MGRQAESGCTWVGVPMIMLLRVWLCCDTVDMGGGVHHCSLCCMPGRSAAPIFASMVSAEKCTCHACITHGLFATCITVPMPVCLPACLLLHVDVDAVVECTVFDWQFGPYHIYRCGAACNMHRLTKHCKITVLGLVNAQTFTCKQRNMHRLTKHRADQPQ